MSLVATMTKKAEETTDYCTYGTVKVDEEVMYLVRQAAPKMRKSVQEYVSDLLNQAAAADLGAKPVKRKLPKPRGH